MNNVKISLVIPAYNREDLIKDAIESALNQNEKIDEIIIIDNNSTDETFEIAKDYAEKNDNIRVVRNSENVGMINNWNNGIKESKYEYVSLLHSDDILAKDWCETVKSYIKNNSDKNVGLYFGIYACFRNEKGKMKIISKVRNFRKDTFLKPIESVSRLWKNFYGNPNCSAAIVYKSSIFKEIGFFDASQGTEADQHFHIKVLNKYNSFYIDKELVYYRRHEFQAFDMEKEVETSKTSVRRLKNAINIQKNNLVDPELVKYTYCGALLYAISFMLKFQIDPAMDILKIDGILNFKTIVNFPRFVFKFLIRKFFSRYL